MTRKVFSKIFICFSIIKFSQNFVYANYPIYQGVEYTSNEFNKIGVVDYLEARTLKRLTVVNIKARLERPVFPDLVSFN